MLTICLLAARRLIMLALLIGTLASAASRVPIIEVLEPVGVEATYMTEIIYIIVTVPRPLRLVLQELPRANYDDGSVFVIFYDGSRALWVVNSLALRARSVW
jgi:hypothetical protein